MEVKNFIRNYKVVPVVVFNSIDEVRPKLKAMCDGGLPIAEITYRTACAGEAIKIAIEDFPEMLVGAGTVINAKQCEEALSLGAKFIVSPGFSEEVAKICVEKGVPYLGGCVTPTEIMTALSYGCDIIKFFPASNYGGIGTMKALSAAFPAASFLPTGGISDKNLAEFLEWDKIFAVGGSWMMKGTPEEIAEKCAEAVRIAKG
ncbi:MAG: bifunctional 4-hydroxy-2-oxoglutarate aldolase/2-dehydro-3-deoxy-phosphogluconate aldolase [Oscillospiraceae bacterium]|nr:bifunctional 4-hydroxy-2-oxoglutarate aldolase/2-dehydro-3-deoxy-phosphogluconate aldolase [Oscillospiraceae bacterium]